MSLAVGDRVQPLDGYSTGTLEQIRASSPSSDRHYLVAEVLWDTGARCAEPLAWLGRLEDVQAAERARQSAERKERRQHSADYQPRRCEGCAKVFTPRDKRQRFHSPRCRRQETKVSKEAKGLRQARLRVDKQEEVRGHGGGQNRVPARHEIDPLRVDKRVYRDCARCSRTFTPIRSTAKYCSSACKKAAYRSRVAA